MINTKHLDKTAACLVIVLLIASAALLINAYQSVEHLGTWIWERHQHQFSWYSRPLFLIPACYYAYRRKLWFIIGFMALLGCSLFWFQAPENVAPHIAEYLEWEKQLFFTNDSPLPLLLLIIAVVVFLFGLFYALWQRNLWIGLILINIGTILKIIVSLALGEQAGTTAITPSLSSLAIINIFALLIWLRSKSAA